MSLVPALNTGPLMLIAASAAIAVLAAPAAALAVGPAPAAHTAKKKKKKKKKKVLTATVSGTFSIRQDIEGGFGNDGGPNWQQLSVTVKDATVPFNRLPILSAAAKATATFTYHAEASTEDRSYHAGCDTERRETNGTWTGKTDVFIRETKYLQTNGKSKPFGGWKVTVTPPDELPLTSKGFYQDWESILMTNCQTFTANTPLGAWGVGFAEPAGVGRLAADNRSVPLLSIDTDKGQTGKADGKLKFNKAPR